MFYLLRITGALWAGIGAIDIIGMPWGNEAEFSSAFLAAGLTFNFVLFVIPGLVLCALSSLVRGRPSQA